MTGSVIRETDLYEPVKRFLEEAGYEVKAEINGCDVVANKQDAPPVIVELKLVFSLELVLQGINRQQISDDVYLAVRVPETPAKRRNWRARQRAIINLCRRLGLGLMLINPGEKSTRPVDVLQDPAPYRPRKSKRQQARLQQEFLTRSGDPNTAGVSRKTIMTAYRQDAVRCALALAEGSALGIAEIKTTTGVSRAASILQKNHYGWFERVARGIYQLSELGKVALQTHGDNLPE